MTNVQLYLSIGIPTFTVILALLVALFQNNRLADRMDRIADRLADKIESTNGKIETTNHATNIRIDTMNTRIDAMNSKIDAVRTEHHADFKMLMEQIVRLNERIAKVEG